MPRTKVIAKRDLLPFFKKGDEATIVPVFYEKDTVIVNKIYGLFKDGNFITLCGQRTLDNSLRGVETRLVSNEQIAPKGSYKDSYIELKDGRQYPSSLVRRYEDFFEKVI